VLCAKEEHTKKCKLNALQFIKTVLKRYKKISTTLPADVIQTDNVTHHRRIKHLMPHLHRNWLLLYLLYTYTAVRYSVVKKNMTLMNEK